MLSNQRIVYRIRKYKVTYYSLAQFVIRLQKTFSYFMAHFCLFRILRFHWLNSLWPTNNAMHYKYGSTSNVITAFTKRHYLIQRSKMSFVTWRKHFVEIWIEFHIVFIERDSFEVLSVKLWPFRSQCKDTLYPGNLYVTVEPVVCNWDTMMTSSNGNIFRVTGHLCWEFTGHQWNPARRPGTWNFDVFFDLRLNKRLSNQSWGWWFETPSRPLRRHCNTLSVFLLLSNHYLNQSGFMSTDRQATSYTDIWILNIFLKKLVYYLFQNGGYFLRTPHSNLLLFHRWRHVYREIPITFYSAKERTSQTLNVAS